MATHQSTAAERLRGEIRAEMARRKITRQALSDASSIPLHALDRRLSGAVDISFDESVRIAAALGVPYDDLLARTTGSAA